MFRKKKTLLAPSVAIQPRSDGSPPWLHAEHLLGGGPDGRWASRQVARGQHFGYGLIDFAPISSVDLPDKANIIDVRFPFRWRTNSSSFAEVQIYWEPLFGTADSSGLQPVASRDADGGHWDAPQQRLRQAISTLGSMRTLVDALRDGVGKVSVLGNATSPDNPIEVDYIALAIDYH